jgi:autotransporter-associated beta strand protein
MTFAGLISGTGTISQIGAGTTVLTGTNSYSGSSLISAGTLTGTASSFGTGAIQDEAALAIDQPSDAIFANAINGLSGPCSMESNECSPGRQRRNLYLPVIQLESQMVRLTQKWCVAW